MFQKHDVNTKRLLSFCGCKYHPHWQFYLDINKTRKHVKTIPTQKRADPEGKKTARLARSFEEDDEKGSCLQLWYYLAGESNGKLNVWLEYNSPFDEEHPAVVLWSRDSAHGDLGQMWRFGQVAVKTSEYFVVVIEGEYRITLTF